MNEAIKMHTGSALLVAYQHADPAAIIGAFCDEMSVRLKGESQRRDVKLAHRIGLNVAATVMKKTAESVKDMEVKRRGTSDRPGKGAAGDA